MSISWVPSPKIWKRGGGGSTAKRHIQTEKGTQRQNKTILETDGLAKLSITSVYTKLQPILTRFKWNWEQDPRGISITPTRQGNIGIAGLYTIIAWSAPKRYIEACTRFPDDTATTHPPHRSPPPMQKRCGRNLPVVARTTGESDAD